MMKLSQKSLLKKILAKFNNIFIRYEKTVKTIGMEYFDIEKFCRDYKKAFMSEKLSPDFLNRISSNLEFYCVGQLNKLVPKKMYESGAYLMGTLLPTGQGAYNFTKYIISYAYDNKLISQDEQDIALSNLSDMRKDVLSL